MSLFSKKSKVKKAKPEDVAPAPVRGQARMNGAAPSAAAPPLRNGVAPPPAPIAAPVAPPRPAPPPPAPAPHLSAEALQKSREEAARTLMSLGQIVSVLMRSPHFRDTTLAAMRALVGPAIRTGQFMVTTTQDKTRGHTGPVAVVMWANVSPDVDRRLSAATDQGFQLRANEWQSGDIAWLISAVGDADVLQPMIATLQQSRLKGKSIKTRLAGKDGKMAVRTLQPGAKLAALEGA